MTRIERIKADFKDKNGFKTLKNKNKNGFKALSLICLYPAFSVVSVLKFLLVLPRR